MDKPTKFSTIRQLQEANHMQQIKKLPVPKASVPSAEALKKVNVCSTRSIYTNLTQFNVNDATFTPRSVSSHMERLKSAAEYDHRPNLSDYHHRICPLNHFEAEPRINLQVLRHEYNVHSTLASNVSK